MASNLSSIGFHFADADAFAETMEEIARDARERVSCEPGDYLVWQSQAGPEVWFHLPLFGNEDVGADLAGLTPFFSGDSAVPLRLVARISRPDDNAFEGAFKAWVAPVAESGEGSYPIVVDAVDFAAHADRPLPARVTARVTGFARKLTVFPNEAAFTLAQNSDQYPGLATRAFIPLGLMPSITDDDGGDERSGTSAADTGDTPPTSAAVFTGRIVKHLPLINEVSGRAFHWLVVESLDATYDIVADPDVVEGEPQEGTLVQATCMMFGRLLD